MCESRELEVQNFHVVNLLEVEVDHFHILTVCLFIVDTSLTNCEEDRELACSFFMLTFSSIPSLGGN